MLVIISDLHLTDGSTARNPHASAFDLLCSEVAASAKNNRARDIKVVLLGDIVDLVRTDYWHRNRIRPEERPWGGANLDPRTGMNPDDARNEAQFRDVLRGVVAQPAWQGLARALRTFEDITGKHAAVQYIIGNHDRVLNNYDNLKHDLAAALDPLDVSFSNELREPEYGVFGRHGHEWDVNCHGWKFLTKVLNPKSKAGQFDAESYKVMALGEVITAELMAGLVYYVKERLNSPEHKRFHDIIMEVNNVRPMTHALQWIIWLLEQQSTKYLETSLDALREAINDTLATTLAKRWDAIKRDYIVSGDLTDHLQRIRSILDHDDRVKKLQKLGGLFEKVEGALAAVGASGKDSFYAGARSEFEAGQLPAGTQYVLYGHTHSALQRPISAQRNGDVQMYVNTGTFLPLIERAGDNATFVESNRMTFLCFYNSDEDDRNRLGDGPTMDVWDGMKRKFYLPDPPLPSGLATAQPQPVVAPHG